MVVIAGLTLFALVLVLLVAKPAAARDTARAAYLDACASLFETAQKGVADTGFARLSGRYRGQMFDVQLVPDSLNMRKLPCLWLLVTLVERQPVTTTLDAMMRATGAETFSKFGNLPDLITTSEGFPEGCTLRGDGVPAPGLCDAVRRCMIAADPACLKEVVVAPTGLRLVWLLQEADRGRYLLFRDAELGGTPLTPAVLLPLMDRLCSLSADIAERLAQASPHERRAG